MQYTLPTLLALATAALAQGITLTGYFASDACEFTSDTFVAGQGCQNFPAPVMSFTNKPVNVQQIVIYAGENCSGAGTTIHMDYDGCQSAYIHSIEGLGEPASNTAASYCIEQEGVNCP